MQGCVVDSTTVEDLLGMDRRVRVDRDGAVGA
jgi:hypothetical protein